jgi:hypothetical protein
MWNPVPGANFHANGFNLTLDKDPSIYQLSNGFYIAGEAPASSSTKTSVLGYSTSVIGYSTSSADYSTTAYPTSAIISATYSAGNTETYSASTTAVASYTASATPSWTTTTSAVVTPPVYQNSTATGTATDSPYPSTGAYTTTSQAPGAPAGTGSAKPSTTTGPSVNAASGNVATGAVALIGGLLLAFAM